MAALGLGSSTGEIESPEIESLCNERSAEDNDGDIGLGFRPGNVSCSNSLDEILLVRQFPNIGLPKNMYELIRERTRETVDMLSEYGHKIR